MRARVRWGAWSEGVATGGDAGSAMRGFLSSRAIQVGLATGFHVTLIFGKCGGCWLAPAQGGQVWH